MRRTVAAVAGISGVLALTGCSAIPGLGTRTVAHTSTGGTANGPWTTVVTSGPPRPSPAPAPYIPSPSPSTGFLTLPPVAKRTTSAGGLCTAPETRNRGLPIDVTVKGGTATVSWFHNGDASIDEYRVTSVLQTTRIGDQKNLKWISVAPKPGCARLTARISGLARGSSYEIWVDTVATSVTSDHPVDLMVGRSPGFIVK